MTTWATLADAPNYGIPTTSFGALTLAQLQAQMDAANAKVTTYLRKRYGLDTNPATSWGVELTEAACVLFARGAMMLRGYSPANPGDVSIESRAMTTIRWLEQVQHLSAHPEVVQGSAPAAATTRPRVMSSSNVATASGRTGTNREW